MRQSEGLALIDDVSRLLCAISAGWPRFARPPSPWAARSLSDRARLASRLGEVNQGFQQLSDGARQLNQGPHRRGHQASCRALAGAENRAQPDRLRIERAPCGVASQSRRPVKDRAAVASATSPGLAPAAESRSSLIVGTTKCAAAMQMTQGSGPHLGLGRASREPSTWSPPPGSSPARPFRRQPRSVGRAGHSCPGGGRAQRRRSAAQPQATAATARARAISPAENLLAELTRAAGGADQIAQGAQQRPPRSCGRSSTIRWAAGRLTASDHPRKRAWQPRAGAKLRRLHHARRPSRPDRRHPDRPGFLGSGHEPDGDLAALGSRSSWASTRGFP